MTSLETAGQGSGNGGGSWAEKRMRVGEVDVHLDALGWK